MKTLTRAEEQIMEAVWKIRSGFLKDIVDALPPPRPHSNTVGTILKILVDKKFVVYDQQGRNNLYKAAIGREQYAKRSLSSLVKGFFDGSPASVVSHFIKENKMTVAELEELLKQIQSPKK